jgi:hypothetical protein
MLLCRHQNAGQIHGIKINNRCFENVAHFKSLGTTVRNKNLMREEIERRLNLGNAFYHYSVQNFLLIRLLSKIINIGISHYEVPRGGVYLRKWRHFSQGILTVI